MKQRWKTILSLVALFAALALYLFLQSKCFVPGTNEKDCEGYIILGKRLAAGEMAGRPPRTPFEQINHVWVENDRGELIPKYAPGYPFLIGMAYRITGGSDMAVFAVNPILGFLTLVGAWFLFRLRLGRFASAAGVWLLMLHPFFQSYSGYPLAHAMEGCALVCGFAMLGHWAKNKGYASAIGAGIALGCAVAARHTAILYALPLGTAIVWTVVAALRASGGFTAEKRRAVFSAVALGLAYAVIPILIALYHWRWFGSPFHSGYFLTGEQQALKTAYALENIATVIHGLNEDCGIMLFALAIAGVLACGNRLVRVVGAECMIVATAPYMFYYWAPWSNAFTRFFYPLTPLFIFFALLAMQSLVSSRKHPRTLLACFAAIAVLSWLPKVAEPFWGQSMSHSGYMQSETGKAIRPHLREDAVLFMEQPLDLGVGAFRRYEPYRLFAFNPGILDQEMPYWKEPWEREGYERWNRWPIKVQESRRRKLQPLYDELGWEGLRQRHASLANEFIGEGRQVAYLLRTDGNPLGRANLPPDCGFTLEALAAFDVPGLGNWTIYEAQKKD